MKLSEQGDLLDEEGGRPSAVDDAIVAFLTCPVGS
jgi:hypothetical protein